MSFGVSRLLAVLGTSVLLVSACSSAAPSPTAPPKTTEAPKPAAPAAASPAAAPAAVSPAAVPAAASPAVAPAAASPAAAPAASPAAKPATYDEKAVADFYRGKTFKILVGLAAGGGFDTIYRLWGRHAGKYIPGNPTVVVENMTGAGGLVAANSLYSAQPKDGTVMGSMDLFTTVLGYKAGAQGIELDPARFNWIGNPGDTSPPTCTLRTELGYKTFDDVLKADQELVLGASGKGNVFYATPRVVAAATGAKFKLIEGYAGNPAVRLAVDQKELDGACWTVASMKTTASNWFEGNPPPMTIVLQAAKQPYPELPNVPLLRSYVKDPALLKMVDVLETASYNTYLAAFPPGVPADRVAALRDAWLKTWDDPDLKQELARTAFKFAPVSGQDTEKVINDFLAMTPEEGTNIGKLFGLIE